MKRYTLQSAESSVIALACDVSAKEKPRGQPELRQNCVGIVPVNNSYC
jgi:hypothetical protein